MSVNGAGDRCGCMISPNAVSDDPQRRPQQHRGDDGGGNRFGLAVAVGMVFVRRRRRHDQSAPHDERTENVGEGFNRIGDERVRMAGNARGEFRARQHDIDGHARKGGAQAALEAIQWHRRN